MFQLLAILLVALLEQYVSVNHTQHTQQMKAPPTGLTGPSLMKMHQQPPNIHQMTPAHIQQSFQKLHQQLSDVDKHLTPNNMKPQNLHTNSKIKTDELRDFLEDKTLLEQQLHLLTLQGKHVATTVARNVSLVSSRSYGSHWHNKFTSLLFCTVPEHAVVVDRPWFKPCGWQCERRYEAVGEFCCLTSELPPNALWLTEKTTNIKTSSCQFRCHDGYIRRSPGTCCLDLPKHASWIGTEGCGRQCDVGYTSCFGACCINKATEFRKDWSPLPLIPPPLDYFTANDLDSLLYNGSSPQSECTLNALDMAKGRLHSLYGHSWDCTNSSKEALFMRHRSTIVPPITIYHRLIQELQARGANTLLLLGDSISGQHMTDSICLAEFGGYNYTLDRGNGYELVLEISHPSHPSSRITNGLNSTVTHGLNGTIHNSTTHNGTHHGTHHTINTYPYFLMALIPYRDDDENARKNIKAFNATYQNKIKGHPLVVANYGLHFKGYRNQQGEYRRRLKQFLHSVDNAFTYLNHTIIYRETSAQHFSQTYTGEYSDGAQYSTKRCAPLNISEESHHKFDWRNAVLRSILSNSTTFRLNQAIEIVPFYNLTAALYDLHARDGVQGDCTHYCYPALRLIFANVWSSILDIVRRM